MDYQEYTTNSPLSGNRAMLRSGSDRAEALFWMQTNRASPRTGVSAGCDKICLSGYGQRLQLGDLISDYVEATLPEGCLADIDARAGKHFC
ncbi:MAG: hypothetical protein ROW52_03955, partial [Anaerolineaceae bacterium]